MLGRFEEVRAILGEERASQAERGGGIVLAGVLGFDSVELELLAGDHAAAVRYGLEGCRLLRGARRAKLSVRGIGLARTGVLRARRARRGRDLGRPVARARRERRPAGPDAVEPGVGQG